MSSALALGTPNHFHKSTPLHNSISCDAQHDVLNTIAFAVCLYLV